MITENYIGLHVEFLDWVKNYNRGPEPINFYTENDMPYSAHVEVKEQPTVVNSFLLLHKLLRPKQVLRLDGPFTFFII